MKRIVWLLLIMGVGLQGGLYAQATLLNVSYDPTREFYKELNPKFSAYWKEKTGISVTIQQSHGGSGKQARAVIDGLGADVVTLALSYDIDQIAKKANLLPENWQKQLPNNSSPFYSTIVFLVRKGNPKKIRDWSDLIKPGVEVITPSPKTGGGARYNVLAAWQSALDRTKSEAKANAYLKDLFKHVPVLDSGARGSTTTFTQRGIGDVLITWENEALLLTLEKEKGQFELVYPPQSIRADIPVAVVEKNAKTHGTSRVAKAYLTYLFLPDGQTIGAKYYYRPKDKRVFDTFKQQFPAVKMITVEEKFGGWDKANAKFFDDGALFDQIYTSR